MLCCRLCEHRSAHQVTGLQCSTTALLHEGEQASVEGLLALPSHRSPAPSKQAAMVHAAGHLRVRAQKLQHLVPLLPGPLRQPHSGRHPAQRHAPWHGGVKGWDCTGCKCMDCCEALQLMNQRSQMLANIELPRPACMQTMLCTVGRQMLLISLSRPCRGDQCNRRTAAVRAARGAAARWLARRVQRLPATQNKW